MNPLIVVGLGAAFLFLTKPGKRVRKQVGLGGWRRLHAKRTGSRQNRRRPSRKSR